MDFLNCQYEEDDDRSVFGTNEQKTDSKDQFDERDSPTSPCEDGCGQSDIGESCHTSRDCHYRLLCHKEKCVSRAEEDDECRSHKDCRLH